MKISDLMEKKNRRVKVRVPTKLQDKLGAQVSGTVIGFRPKGKVTWVRVKLARKGEFLFRPQDLAAA